MICLGKSEMKACKSRTVRFAESVSVCLESPPFENRSMTPVFRVMTPFLKGQKETPGVVIAMCFFCFPLITRNKRHFGIGQISGYSPRVPTTY